jgi:hypothetical protein
MGKELEGNGHDVIELFLSTGIERLRESVMYPMYNNHCLCQNSNWAHSKYKFDAPPTCLVL